MKKHQLASPLPLYWRLSAPSETSAGIQETASTQTWPPMIESHTSMNYHPHPEKLSRLSAHLEELFSRVSGCGREPLTPELADEIAVTAGEVMIELADHGGDELARQVIEDARRLREAVRTVCPEPARVAQAGGALVSDLELIIREDKRAA